MSVIIKRPETEDEILRKAYVHWRSWQDTYPGIVDQGFLDALSLEKCEAIARRVTDGVLVAKDCGAVVGFVAYGSYRGGDLENTGEITAIYLLADHCGRGIGRQLMQAGLAELSVFPRVAVWVLKENTRAIRFYERCGFSADGCEKTICLGSPVTEIRMILDRQTHDDGGAE